MCKQIQNKLSQNREAILSLESHGAKEVWKTGEMNEWFGNVNRGVELLQSKLFINSLFKSGTAPAKLRVDLDSLGDWARVSRQMGSPKGYCVFPCALFLINTGDCLVERAAHRACASVRLA